jgi:hypothetical protein
MTEHTYNNRYNRPYDHLIDEDKGAQEFGPLLEDITEADIVHVDLVPARDIWVAMAKKGAAEA